MHPSVNALTSEVIYILKKSKDYVHVYGMGILYTRKMQPPERDCHYLVPAEGLNSPAASQNWLPASQNWPVASQK